MSLEDEMRTTLTREADARAVPSPDVAGLILRGRARRRRRNVVRLSVGVVATALVGATAFGIVHLEPRADGEFASEPRHSPRAILETRSQNGRGTLEPGPYLMAVGQDSAGEWVVANVTVDGPRWQDGDFPIVSDQPGGPYAGFGAYQPEVLAAGTGCEDDVTTLVRKTPDRLAEQLARLPRSTVLQEPARTELFDRPATHLRLRIDVDCPTYYRVAHSAAGTRGITYAPIGPTAVDVVIDFWVLEVGGVPLVVDQWHDVDAPSGLVDRARDARESITFVED